MRIHRTRPASASQRYRLALDAPRRVLALRRIEFESSRLIQAQIVFLKGPDLLPVRDAVTAAVEQRHRQVRETWEAMLAGIGVQQAARD